MYVPVDRSLIQEDWKSSSCVLRLMKHKITAVYCLNSSQRIAVKRGMSTHLRLPVLHNFYDKDIYTPHLACQEIACEIHSARDSLP